MSKRQWLCLFGAWVMVFLFLGVPSLWHKIIALLSGLIVIIIAYNLPHEKRQNTSANSSAFIENNNQSPLV